MSNQNDTPSTAVALTPSAEEVRAVLKNADPQDKITRAMNRELANRRFGRQITPAEAGALAEWAMETGVRLEHVVLFGGMPSIMAEGYMEQAGVIFPTSSYEFVDIMEDLGKRKFWGCPEFALACYETRFWRNRSDRDAGREPDVVECNWAPRTLARNEQGKLLDSVGIEHPHKTARTRSARRALRIITPIGTKRAEQIERRLKDLHVQAKVLDAPAEPSTPVSLPDDPYAHAPQLSRGTRSEPPRMEGCRYCGVVEDDHNGEGFDHPFTDAVPAPVEPSGFEVGDED